MIKKIFQAFLSLIIVLPIGFFAQHRVSESAELQVNDSDLEQKRILMFVAYNDVWWSEYKVLYEALIARGYHVDVRSSSAGEAWTYGGGINATPSAGGGYPAADGVTSED